jgi:hypothetical protein
MTGEDLTMKFLTPEGIEFDTESPEWHYPLNDTNPLTNGQRRRPAYDDPYADFDPLCGITWQEEQRGQYVAKFGTEIAERVKPKTLVFLHHMLKRLAYHEDRHIVFRGYLRTPAQLQKSFGRVKAYKKDEIWVGLPNMAREDFDVDGPCDNRFATKTPEGHAIRTVDDWLTYQVARDFYRATGLRSDTSASFINATISTPLEGLYVGKDWVAIGHLRPSGKTPALIRESAIRQIPEVTKYISGVHAAVVQGMIAGVRELTLQFPDPTKYYPTIDRANAIDAKKLIGVWLDKVRSPEEATYTTLLVDGTTPWPSLD